REQPEEERRIELRGLHQTVGGQDVDDAAAAVRLKQVVDVEHRFSEELVSALLLECEKAPLDRANRRRRDVAVVRLERLRIVAGVLQQRAQVLEVQQQQAIVVRDLEHQRQNAGLRLVEVEYPRQQERPHVGDRCTHRVALRAENIPEHRRKSGEFRLVDANQL